MANVQEKVSNVQEQVERAMERMGEAAQSVGQKVSDFFQGNPFDTSVGRKIELATDANKLATENWGLNMEICDFINSTNEGPRDAIRAIKKRLQTQMGKNNAIVMFTLTVLETCVKNCDIRFTTLVCQKEFLGELIKLISAKHDAPQIVQERILILIQSWADAFRGNLALSGVVEMYDELKAKGVEFPATNLDSLAPIITPKQTVFPFTEQKLATEITDNIQSLQHNIPISTTKIQQQQQPFQIQNPIGPMQLSPDQMAKLRSELDIVQINITVLRDLITQIKPTNNEEKLQPTEDFHFLQELHAASIEMQKRITDLIPVITNEEVTYELLSINDELNSTFEKYNRCMAKFNSHGVDITMIPSGSGSKTTDGASQPQSSDLIDFASETYPKVENSSLESTKELNQQLGGIDLDNTVTEMNQQPILAKDNEARNECYIHDQAQVGIHTVSNIRSESIGMTETDKEKSEKKNIEPKKADDDGL